MVGFHFTLKGMLKIILIIKTPTKPASVHVWLVWGGGGVGGVGGALGQGGLHLWGEGLPRTGCSYLHQHQGAAFPPTDGDKLRKGEEGEAGLGLLGGRDEDWGASREGSSSPTAVLGLSRPMRPPP